VRNARRASHPCIGIDRGGWSGGQTCLDNAVTAKNGQMNGLIRTGAARNQRGTDIVPELDRRASPPAHEEILSAAEDVGEAFDTTTDPKRQTGEVILLPSGNRRLAEVQRRLNARQMAPPIVWHPLPDLFKRSGVPRRQSGVLLVHAGKFMRLRASIRE
jgi:hypothetical protein